MKGASGGIFSEGELRAEAVVVDGALRASEGRGRGLRGDEARHWRRGGTLRLLKIS
jgi:hypothetical protein